MAILEFVLIYFDCPSDSSIFLGFLVWQPFLPYLCALLFSLCVYVKGIVQVILVFFRVCWSFFFISDK
jgi:hypothetical protein